VPVEPAGGDAPWLTKYLLQEELRVLGLTNLATSVDSDLARLATTVGKSLEPSARERLEHARPYEFGAVVQATVRQVAEYGIVLDLPHGFSGFVIKDQARGMQRERHEL